MVPTHTVGIFRIEVDVEFRLNPCLQSKINQSTVYFDDLVEHCNLKLKASYTLPVIFISPLLCFKTIDSAQEISCINHLF